MSGDPAAFRTTNPAVRAGAQPAGTVGTSHPPQTVDSQTLLQGRSTLLIHHQGEVYRLQLTRQGKLILTK